MRILVIIDPLESIKTYKDSTYAMMTEATSRRHELHVTMQEDLMWKGSRVMAATSRLTLTGGSDDWYALSSPKETLLTEFDCVLMRKDPPFDLEYVVSTWLLDHAEWEGARVFNRPRAIRDHSEKLAIMQFTRFTVPTAVTRSPEQIQAFITEHHDCILKPLEGMGGQGIFRVREDDPNRNVIVETLTGGGRTAMVQRYIPEIRDGDKRVLLIAGKPVPFCLARIPKTGETRGNLAAGGTGVARPLGPRDLEIANTLGPQLFARGLLLVGLDVIGDYLTEINVTSPTCFQEIQQQTGFNVAGMFMDAVEQAVEQPRDRHP